MIQAVVNMVVLALAVLAISRLLPGIRCKNFKTALLVAVGLAVMNFVVWKLLFFLALPFMLFTGFLGYFLISAAILWVVDQWVEDFEVKGVGTLVLASSGIALLNAILNWLLGRLF